MNPSKRVLKLSLLVFLLSTGINAQELNDKAIQMQKVVVSATGFEQDADNNLRNVIVIDGKDLEKRGFNTLEQALERISGISFCKFWTRTQYRYAWTRKQVQYSCESYGKWKCY